MNVPLSPHQTQPSRPDFYSSSSQPHQLSPHVDSQNRSLLLENEPSNETMYQVILFQNKEETHQLKKVKSLVAESFNSAVLDSGAARTLCGYIWFRVFCESLMKTIPTRPCSSVYKFGASEPVVAKRSAVIPVVIGNETIHITTDIVELDVPFLLSRAAMKKLNMIINFGTDSVTFHGITYPLNVTSSGHYTIPLTPSVQLLSTHKYLPETQVIFTTTTTLSKSQQALKLHRQFAHAPSDRLISLMNAAGKPWSLDKELKSELRNVENNCQTCLEYAKELPRPTVGLPSANFFQDTVALDLKFYNGKILIHLIDHATRYSACGRIPSKQPEIVVKAMFAHWIVIFGPPQKFLSDNGGEFINQAFLDLCEAYNITIKTTGAEAPWSNGLVERHNQVLGNMLDKVLQDLKCHFDIALAWCVNSKNSLQNVHGFSPYQLVFGQNPVLPSPFSNRPPALEDIQSRSSDIVRENLNAQHASRVAFMESERSERLRRALRTNTRTYSDQVIINGDKVFYKRKESKRWKGPAFVLGKDGQQVLLKHGGFYIRVHPCRVRLAREDQNCSKKQVVETDKQVECNQQDEPSHSNKQEQSSSSSDSEEEPEVNDQNSLHANDSSANNEEIEQLSPDVQSLTPSPPKKPQTRRAHRRSHPTSVTTATASKLPASPMKCNSVLTFKKGEKLLVKLSDSQSFIPCVLLNRSGKVSSKKYRNEWNVQYTNGDIAVLNFNTDVAEWMYSEQSTSDTEVVTLFNSNPHIDVEVEQAKSEELDAWKSHNVYKAVSNEGQACINVRWVITPKMINGVPTVKARLVAKGYQEEQNFRKDSPTCSRESIRLVLAVIASKKWKLLGFDIRRAFLQGDEIDREVYLKPPPEANTNLIWKLCKCVYGLGDASRSFYLKLRNELLKLGAVQSPLDQGLYFFFKGTEIAGILAAHVDDIMHGGDAVFQTSVIQPLSKILLFSTQHDSIFEYLGLSLIQNSDYSISVNQHNYTQSIKKIQLPDQVNYEDLLSEPEKECFRSAVGQLTWLAGISRPEISYHVCVAASVASSATVRDAIQLNKVIKKVQNSTSFITFPSMDFDSIHICVFTDGSYNNLSDGCSQGGQIAFLADRNGNSCPIAWKSHKLKRVVRSALAAETLSFCDGCERAHFLISLIEPLTGEMKQPVQGYIDSQSLYEALGTTSQVQDCRLRVEISALRQMVEEGEVRVHWVPKEQQLADVLTKNTASDKSLVQVLQKGSFQ